MRGGDGAQSSSEVPLVNKSGKPFAVDEPVSTYPAVSCAQCPGDVPKSIAKKCLYFDLWFHPGHYQTHRDEWPCQQIDHDLCLWCDGHIEEPNRNDTRQIWDLGNRFILFFGRGDRIWKVLFVGIG